MTEFTTTKIGDRWFLVFEEGLFRVDEVAEMWTTYELAPIKPGQVRIRSTLGGFEDVTPVKSKQPQTNVPYLTPTTIGKDKWHAVKPNPQFSDELNRHYASKGVK